MVLAAKYSRKEEKGPFRRKMPEGRNIVQKKEAPSLKNNYFFQPQVKRDGKVCQLARGEQQEDGSWKTYSSFRSKEVIDKDNWVVTCYRTQSVPAHRMLALEGHNGVTGWECSQHLQTPDMANNTQFGNIMRMGLNSIGMCKMKCHPEFRNDLRAKAAENREMPHEHVSLRISSADGQALNQKMEAENNKEYDYDVKGGDGVNSFNCKTWVQYMYRPFEGMGI